MKRLKIDYDKIKTVDDLKLIHSLFIYPIYANGSGTKKIEHLLLDEDKAELYKTPIQQKDSIDWFGIILALLGVIFVLFLIFVLINGGGCSK